ncbi:MAG TPA: DNA recombination protein RmuC [Burkholderiaceae bacterium]|nr:DNA recombination protein RmuC [Burkholderiaceae bacterium]
MDLTILVGIALGLLLLLLVLTVVLLLRRDGSAALAGRLDELGHANERLERELRAALDANASQARIETGARLQEVQGALLSQLTGLAQLQTGQLGQFGTQVARASEQMDEGARANREESARALANFAAQQQAQLAELARSLQLNLAEIRSNLNTQLASLQAGNEAKLEQMRATVEEKLQSTLEARLGESFRQVSERLEEVHRGLGEMRGLAAGVGDLKRVLTNVKTRGGFGEVQLGALLEQMLTPDQFERNVVTRPGSNERVEFAVKLPGASGGDGAPLWLPIDAKFPIEDYERLLAAQERADLVAMEEAARALEARVRKEARTIRDKYVEPPHTTEFAFLFLPSEGLYAEVLRRPGLVESLQRELRVVPAGPTTLAAMLNSLQMGFRTLAIEKRSAEVWQVLGAVKSEFGKFGEVLAKLRSQLATASNTIESAEVRTRAMTRALKTVEALPAEQSTKLLPPDAPDEG